MTLISLLQRSQSKHTVLIVMRARITWYRVHRNGLLGDDLYGAAKTENAGASCGTCLSLELLHLDPVMGIEQHQESLVTFKMVLCFYDQQLKSLMHSRIRLALPKASV